MKIALKIYVYKNVLKREMGDDRGNNQLQNNKNAQ